MPSATADQIKLAVDEAFYNALQTFAEQKVAEQTVSARQMVSDQITTLFQNKLRSQLDVSFADANLAQAKLLLLDAQNNYQAALSTLSQVLGYSAQQPFELVDTETDVAAAARCGQPAGGRGLQQPAGDCLAELRISGRPAFPEGRARPAFPQRRSAGRRRAHARTAAP